MQNTGRSSPGSISGFQSVFMLFLCGDGFVSVQQQTCSGSLQLLPAGPALRRSASWCLCEDRGVAREDEVR